MHDEEKLGEGDTELGATLVDEKTDVRLVAAPGIEDDDRYVAQGALGQGGMGIVSLHYDRRIGRRVARKELRTELARYRDIQGRFLREAQIQGQLEHPAVVPVYDLGVGTEGAPYFTMRTVRGVTLLEILDGLRAGNEDVARKHTRHRLLTAFASACLAVDYAHERGILHRDLKPANIMLGDYGEVYVLDWGLAKVRSAGDEPELRLADAPSPATNPVTQAGSALGTPGYMPPEQMDHPGTVGVTADVYALGAILFEILTYLPLHRGAAIGELVDSTLTGADARPSVRAPDRDVPPELEAVCVMATAHNADQRFPSVRALHDAVQRFLEGERDQSARREASAAHAREAADAVRSIRAGTAPVLEGRRRAMREIGRSLALDPENVEAVTTMVELLSKPPDELPPEVSFEMERQFRRRSRWIGALGAGIYGAMIAFLPLMVWMGIRDPWTIAALFACFAVAMGMSLQVMRAKVQPLGAIFFSLVTSTIAFALVARMLSPLILAPTAIAINATGYALYLQKRHRIGVAIVACLGFLTPLVLELAGVLPRTFEFVDGGIAIHATAVALPVGPTMALIVFGCLAAILVSAIVVGHIRDQLQDAETRLLLYAWHLRELVPARARPSTEPVA